MMQQYYARICWNSNGWRFPSGDAPKSEGKDSYASQNGFGHEEWLFNFMWVFDGYHYAFLQPVNNSLKRLSGKTINVLLWAIRPDKSHVKIGEIRNCQVLTDTQAAEANEYHKKHGWFERMKEDVARVGGNDADLWSWGGLFNIRFSPDDVTQYDDPLPVAKPTDKIAVLKRYTLAAASQNVVFAETPRPRQGSTTMPSQRAYERPGSPGGTVDPYHPVLQAELMKLLQREFDKNKVIRESDGVDITVFCEKRKLLIEIKTYSIAKQAIREALGQILEYAYLTPNLNDPSQSVAVELFIVAPAPSNEKTSAYMNLLRSKFQIPIHYCQFRPGDCLPDALRPI